MTAEQLNDRLATKPFAPCGKQDVLSLGFVPPLGRHGQQWVHSTQGQIMVCIKRQEKMLPGGVVKEQLEEKLHAIREQEGRHVTRSEKQGLKEEIVFSLLPKAFVRSKLEFAYISPQNNWLVINTASSKRAEELLSALRDVLGSLPVTPLMTKHIPGHLMTQWLTTKVVPTPLLLGGECELEAPKEEGRTLKCKQHDLMSDEILSHIHTGMRVKKMALCFEDSVEFLLDHQFTFSRLKFTERVLEQLQDKQPDSAAEEFDTEFAIMSMEINAMINSVIQLFGGADASKEI